MSHAAPTPGQTVGPFFHYGLPYAGDRDVVPPSSVDAVRLHGRVRDGAGEPVPDALIEIWQPAPDGTIPQTSGSLRRDGWTFTGFARASTGRDGRYVISTLPPGPVDGRGAAFFAVTVFARGLMNRLFTRAYLPEESQPRPEALSEDRLLASLPQDERATLVATKDAQGFVFDVRLHGEDETVFLDLAGGPADA